MAKTIQISKLIDKANALFEHSPEDAKSDRLAAANFISSVLHDNKVYAGFNYLKPYSDPSCDTSRVFYYKHHSLT